MKELAGLFRETFGEKPGNMEALPSSGSGRRYFRMSGEGRSVIGAIGPDVAENSTFIELSRHFRRNGLPVPRIYARSSDGIRYLQEDLGNVTVFEAVANGRKSGHYDETETAILKKAIALLPSVQYGGASGLDFSICYPLREFDAMSVHFDLNYFKYCFLKTTGMPFDEVRLEKDFEALCKRLLKDDPDTFMFRDFQSRNIMLKDGMPYLIDYQGGRRGPVYYDVASFIWQAKARYGRELKEELLDSYLEALSRFTVVDRERFTAEYRHFILFRTLQVLGAYGFRGNYERKAHFRESIPFAMANIEELLETPFEEYPYLNRLLQDLVVGYCHKGKKYTDGKLWVRVFSFSYRNGLPDDGSGNGGGYVFDCRGVPNPGRLEAYRSMTGLDRPVVDYLEQFEETGEFFGHIRSLADAHIRNYMERGFTDLMFCCGCTGGRHRSVYFAQRLADHLASTYDIHVSLRHIERGIEEDLK